MIQAGPTARKAWDALLTGAGFAGDVLSAPGKGAAASLRWAALGEEPRLEAGSSWKLAGPGLGEMAAQGWGALGDEISKVLVPGTEGVDTSRGRQAAENIMAVPFGVALEGGGLGGAGAVGLGGAAKATWRASPFVRSYPGVSAAKAVEAFAPARAGAKAQYLMGRGLGDELGRGMMTEAAGTAANVTRMEDVLRRSQPYVRASDALQRLGWRMSPVNLGRRLPFAWNEMGPMGQPVPSGVQAVASGTVGVADQIRRGLEEP